MKKMTGRFVTERAVFARVDFTLCDDERGETVCPVVERGKYILMSRQILSLVVAVRFVFSKLNVLPQLIRNFHAAIATLPHQGRVTITFVVERFLLGVKVVFVLVFE